MDGPPNTPPEPLDPSGPMTRDSLDVASERQLASTIDEAERLRFAKQVLLALFLVSLVSFAGYYAWPESRASAAVFELVKVGMLPLVTLVIAFYFPNSRK